MQHILAKYILFYSCKLNVPYIYALINAYSCTTPCDFILSVYGYYYICRIKFIFSLYLLSRSLLVDHRIAR